MNAVLNRRLRLLVGAAALACLVASGPGHAQTPALQPWTSFVTLVCGLNCSDPLGEFTSAQENWTALTSMGTTNWVGASFNGVTLDASSLLAGARVAGASQLDQWLRTGSAASQGEIDQMTAALTSGVGYDVSNITGILPTQNAGQNGDPNAGQYGSQSDNAQLTTDVNTALGIVSDGSNITSMPGNGTNICNTSVSSAQNANAQSFINNMMQIIQGSGTGFSTFGGSSVGSGQRSAGGVFGGGCLEKVMQVTGDSLFKPPGLGNLLSQLGNMFGGGGGSSGGSGGSSSNCSNAPTPLQQVQQSMPTGIFFASAGGFLPYLNYVSGEGSNQTTLIPAAGATANPMTSLASIYQRH